VNRESMLCATGKGESEKGADFNVEIRALSLFRGRKL
jgi:hypothetical protein